MSRGGRRPVGTAQLLRLRLVAPDRQGYRGQQVTILTYNWIGSTQHDEMSRRARMVGCVRIRFSDLSNFAVEAV
jgi:hypothetical protein